MFSCNVFVSESVRHHIHSTLTPSCFFQSSETMEGNTKWIPRTHSHSVPQISTVILRIIFRNLINILPFGGRTEK